MCNSNVPTTTSKRNVSDLPLSEVLGGRLRDSLPVLWVLASGDTEKDIAEGRKMIEAKRHNIFKLKIGSAPCRRRC